MSNFNLDSFVEKIYTYANDPKLIESINKLDSINTTKSQEPTDHTDNFKLTDDSNSINATKSQDSKDYTITLMWKYYNLGYSGTIEMGYIHFKTKEQVEEFINKFLNEGKIELFKSSCGKRFNELEIHDFKETKYSRSCHQFGDGYIQYCNNNNPIWYWLMIEESEKQLNVNCK